MNMVLNIAIIMIICGGAVVYIVNFFKASQAQQLQMITEWLLLAVTQAEKELGGGTGELKLRYVYDMFIQKFKSLAVLISFEQFSLLVDDALIKMRDMLDNNNSIARYVKGDE